MELLKGSLQISHMAYDFIKLTELGRWLHYPHSSLIGAESWYLSSKDTEPVGGNGICTHVSQGDCLWVFTHQKLQGELIHLNVKELSTKEWGQVKVSCSALQNPPWWLILSQNNKSQPLGRFPRERAGRDSELSKSWGPSFQNSRSFPRTRWSEEALAQFPHPVLLMAEVRELQQLPQRQSGREDCTVGRRHCHRAIRVSAGTSRLRPEPQLRMAVLRGCLGSGGPFRPRTHLLSASSVPAQWCAANGHCRGLADRQFELSIRQDWGRAGRHVTLCAKAPS